MGKFVSGEVLHIRKSNKGSADSAEGVLNYVSMFHKAPSWVLSLFSGLLIFITKDTDDECNRIASNK